MPLSRDDFKRPLDPNQIARLKRQKHLPARSYKLGDEKGRYLVVKPRPPHYWRLRYYFDGKSKDMAPGVYPRVSLEAAREKRDAAGRLIFDEGIDPQAKKTAERAAKQNTFKAISEEWVSKGCPIRGSRRRLSSRTISGTLIRPEIHVFPYIGGKAMDDHCHDDFRRVFDRLVSANKLEMANRIRSLCDRMLRFAKGRDRAGILCADLTQHANACVVALAIGAIAFLVIVMSLIRTISI